LFDKVILMKKETMTKYFSTGEIVLWSVSVALIVASFFVFDRKNYITLIASVIGVTSLIFTAKGNPVGQALMVVFGIIYGVISFAQRYYGEMITYVGMTVPMAVFALISWLRHPFEEGKAEVKVNKISKIEYALTVVAGALVAFGFYFILRAFDTANLIWSTVSVATSFFGVYLTFRRSPLFALGYIANDIVLIVLWSLASAENLSFLSMVICFSAFLANDFYTFLSWHRMSKRQSND